jgi:hypothetical protein
MAFLILPSKDNYNTAEPKRTYRLFHLTNCVNNIQTKRVYVLKLLPVTEYNQGKAQVSVSITSCQISLFNIRVSNHHQHYLQLSLYCFQSLCPARVSLLSFGYSVIGNRLYSLNQLGGGPTVQLNSHQRLKVIDPTNLPQERITSFDNVRYPRLVQEKGIVFIASGLTGNISWQPTRHLITARSDHPLDRILTEDLFASIKLATQQAPEDVIVYLTRMRAQNVTTHCLRDLLSQGEMTKETKDSILNTFLAILCAGHNLTYLSTFFITILRRDKTWEPLRNWFATDASAEDYYFPTMNSERPILIPCHVNGAHWVALVRRVINQRVHFLYADDLNHPSIEQHLKDLLLAHAAPEFYPANAIWLHCKSVTFRPHSNECGPRTLFALTTMALHPNPSPNILLPYMSPNLAQILRTWIGSVLLSGSATLPPWVTPSITAAATSLQQQSRPFYLFPWAVVGRPRPESTQLSGRTKSRT